ncbi:MAG: TonB-dependent receptor [Saprospiraceae bacterium]
MANELASLEERYGCSFLYEPQTLRGQTLDKGWEKGCRSLTDCLERISEYSSLQFTEIETGFWAVQPNHPYGRIQGVVITSMGELLAGASVFHPTSQRGTSTDENGYFDLWLPAGEVHLQISFIGYQQVDTSFFLPFGKKMEVSYALKSSIDLQEITIRGSDAVSSAGLFPPPYQISLEKEKYQQPPTTELGQMLQYALPSFHSAYQTIADGTDHIDPAMMRGLGPDQLVVLVNGHRQHTSALLNVNNTVGRGSISTDLNTIPTAAISRVEILPNEAGVLYGSDAVAGVVNLILKDTLCPSSFHFTSSITAQGDGLTLGLGGFWQIYRLQKGFLNLSWRIDNRESVNRSGSYSGPIFGDARDSHADSIALFFNRIQMDHNRVMNVGSAAISNLGFVANMEHRIGWRSILSQVVGFNGRIGESSGFYRFPYQEQKQSGLYPWGFLPEIRPSILDGYWNVQVATQRKGWKFLFSQGTGMNSVDFQIRNSNNASMGLLSPTSFFAGRLGYGHSISQVKATLLDDTRNTSLDLGFAWRHEWYWQQEGERSSWDFYGQYTSTGFPKERGAQVFPGFRPENNVVAHRSSLASFLYWHHNLSHRWHYALSVRGENGAAWGPLFNGNATLQYSLSDAWRFQLSGGIGKRPPALAQLSFSSRVSQFVPIDGQVQGMEIAHLNQQHLLINQLLPQGLQTERSKRYSVRMSYEPQENQSLSLALFHYLIKDRIVLSSRIDEVSHPSVAPLLAAHGLSSLQFFAQAAHSATTVLEGNFRRSWKRGQWDMDMLLTASLSRNRYISAAPSEVLANIEVPLLGREDISYLESGQPASKYIVRLHGGNGCWDFAWQATRFGAVTYLHPADGNPQNWVVNAFTNTIASRDQTFRPKWLQDVSVFWRTSPYWTLSLHLKNIFNVYPDALQHSANTSNGVFVYSRHVQQFGVWGAYGLINWELVF